MLAERYAQKINKGGAEKRSGRPRELGSKEATETGYGSGGDHKSISRTRKERFLDCGRFGKCCWWRYGLAEGEQTGLSECRKGG